MKHDRYTEASGFTVKLRKTPTKVLTIIRPKAQSCSFTTNKIYKNVSGTVYET